MPKKTKSLEDCTEVVKIPLIVLEENRKKMTFRNEKRKSIRKIKVDGCAVTTGIRCDWLVINEKDDEFFVELKGTDIRHACAQLIASISKLSAGLAQKTRYSFVVGSNVSPKINTIIQNLKVQFKNEFNCKLIVKNQRCDFDIETYKLMS